MGSLDFHTHQAIIRKLFSKPGVLSEKAKGRAGTAGGNKPAAVSVKNTGDTRLPF